MQTHPNSTEITHDVRAMAANWADLCCVCTHTLQHCSRPGRLQPKDRMTSRGDHRSWHCTDCISSTMIGCCALHTSRQHHQAKLAPQHSTVPLLKKALDSSTSSAAPPLQRRQCAYMVRQKMSCAKSRSLSCRNMCSPREHVKKQQSLPVIPLRKR